MADYNLVVLAGRLTRDPELKYTQANGVAYAKLSMAINRQVNLPDGNSRKSVTFVDVAVWRHQAELACQFLKKGSTVLVSGDLEQLRWTDAQNQKRAKLRVRCQRIQFLDRKGGGAPSPEPVAAGAGMAGAEDAGGGDVEGDRDDRDE